MGAGDWLSSTPAVSLLSRSHVIPMEVLGHPVELVGAFYLVPTNCSCFLRVHIVQVFIRGPQGCWGREGDKMVPYPSEFSGLFQNRLKLFYKIQRN